MLFQEDTYNGSLKQRDHIREYLYTQQIKKQKLTHDEENTEECDSEKSNSEENNKINKKIYNFIEKNILKKFKNLLTNN